MKVQIPERKAAGKQVIEVTMKTVHFVNALLTKNVEKLQLLSEGTAGDGGYVVPEEFANMIVEDVRDVNIMRQIAAPPMTISGDTLHIPSLVSRPKANWRAEKAAKQTSTASFSENVLTPYSLAVIVGLSNELAADASLGVSGSIVNYVANLMAVSLAEKEEEAFWVGNGSNKPTGVDGGGYTLRTVAAGSGATDAQKAAAIVSAFQRTPQGYRNRGVWVANSQSLEEISRMVDSQGRYLLTQLADSPTQTLRGRPVYEQNNLAGGTALFGDFSYYQIVDREGISVAVSTEATVAGSSAFEKNLTFVRVEKRVDAELLLPAAVTKVTGLGIV
jgi:HK97 family phage major capsid protein